MLQSLTKYAKTICEMKRSRAFIECLIADFVQSPCAITKFLFLGQTWALGYACAMPPKVSSFFNILSY